MEVLLAASVLAFGLASVAGLMAAAGRAMTTAWALEDGTATIQALVDSLSVVSEGASGMREEHPATVTWSVEAGHGAQGWVRYEHPALRGPIEVHFATESTW